MATMENFMTDRRCLLGKSDGSSLTLRDGGEIDRARKRESQTERPRNRKRRRAMALIMCCLGG